MCLEQYDEDNQDAPCETCQVDPFEDNRLSMEMYALVANQLRVSPMGEVFALDYNAIWSTLDRYKIENQKDVFEDIIILFNTEQEIERNKKVVTSKRPQKE